MDLDAMSLFTEAYFGKSDNLIKAEKILERILSKVRNDKLININKLPEAKELEKVLEKQFGFKKVSIYWDFQASPNTYTLINSHVIFKGSSPFKDIKRGYYDEKHVNTICILSCMTEFQQVGLTVPEIMSVLLHEIGHNFNYSPYNCLKFIIHVIQAAKGDLNYIMAEILSGNGLKEYTFFLMSIVDRIIQSSPPLKNFFNIVDNIRLYVLKFHKSLTVPRNMIFCVPSLLLSPITSMYNIARKKDETFADSMAAAYGYATHLAHAVDKIDRFYSGLKFMNNSFGNFLYDLSVATYNLAIIGNGVYGPSTQRAKEMLNKLKKDLENNDYSPEFKNELSIEIDNLEDFYYNYLLNSDENFLVITSLMRRMMEKMFKGIPDITKLFPNIEV